jgi:hypothetical protein
VEGAEASRGGAGGSMGNASCRLDSVHVEVDERRKYFLRERMSARLIPLGNSACTGCHRRAKGQM